MQPWRWGFRVLVSTTRLGIGSVIGVVEGVQLITSNCGGRHIHVIRCIVDTKISRQWDELSMLTLNLQ